MEVAGGPDWLPDGRSIVLGHHDDLWVRPVDSDQKPFALRTTPFIEADVAVSPNGRWIAYSSDLSGRREIYVRAFPSGEEHHKISRDGGVGPRWSADGTELFFLSLNAMLMTARIDTASGYPMTLPQSLFSTGLDIGPRYNHKSYAVARDGKRFLMKVPTVAPDLVPITVVLNWQAKIPR